jgi:hypothetical protein
MLSTHPSCRGSPLFELTAFIGVIRGPLTEPSLDGITITCTRQLDGYRAFMITVDISRHVLLHY